LVLEPPLAEHEVAATALGGRREAVVVPQLGEAPAQLLANRDAVEVGEGDAILSLHPCRGLLRVQILEPAVGIGHPDAVVVVHLIDSAGQGIRGDRSRGRHADADDIGMWMTTPSSPAPATTVCLEIGARS